MISRLIPWFVFAFFGYYLMGGLFSARLGMIDDHEIPYFLGSDGEITLAELPKVIEMTEIGAWGEYLRFRPSYYSLRVLETMLWRDNATMWFVTRYVLLVLSMWMGWRIMSQYFPKILSYLFLFYTMTMPFWADILTRLGPSETYAVLALTLFAYGWQFGKSGLLFLGYIIAVGSKENMLFLLPLLIIWTGIKLLKKTLTKRELIGVILSLGFTAWIVGGIILATSRAGTDIYGAPISYRYRITRFVWDIPKIIAERSMYFSVATTFIMSFIALGKKYRSLVMAPLFCTAILYLSVASQYIFYPDTIPSHSRYDYPALVLIRIIDLVAIYGVVRLTNTWRWNKLLRVALLTMLGIYATLGIYRYGYLHTHSRTTSVVAATTSFASKVDTIITSANKNEDMTIVFVSNRYIDFEPVSSVLRYLNAKEIRNRIEFKYIPQPELSDPLGLHLEGRMIGAMNGNNHEELFERFEVFSNPSDNCSSVTFGDAVPLPACPELVRF